MSNKKNPCVFLDLSLDGIAAKRIVIELFADEVPKTVENFRLLCAGQMVVEGSTTLHYKGTEFSRIHTGAFAQGSTTLHYKGTEFSRIHTGAFAQAPASTKDDFMQMRKLTQGVVSTVTPPIYHLGSVPVGRVTTS
ncbi:putative peptidylprolyl isomerase [Helianthus debilis subsp. tardiflorus]